MGYRRVTRGSIGVEGVGFGEDVRGPLCEANVVVSWKEVSLSGRVVLRVWCPMTRTSILRLM